MLAELISNLNKISCEPDLRTISIEDFLSKLLKVKVWKAQLDFLRAVAARDPITNQILHRNISWKSGHSCGKTFTAALSVIYKLITGGPGTTVVTSAPTNRQVEFQLWKEINTLWARSDQLKALAKPLRKTIEISRDWVAYGFTTDDGDKFQGIHAPNIYVLIDEASGFPENLFEALDTCATGYNAQTVLVGNALVPYGRFYNSFKDNSNNIFKLTTSSREHPNVIFGKELISGAVTRQWIADFEAKWASAPEVISSRIDAIFPENSSQGIISKSLVDRAKKVTANTLWPVIISCDVARYGDNLSVITILQGQKLIKQIHFGRCGITETSRKLLTEINSYNPDYIIIDDDGLGGGVLDITQENYNPELVIPFRSGMPPIDKERFCNNITEAYWLARESFDSDLIALGNISPQLELELITRNYEIDTRGKLKLENKQDFCDRTGQNSPDFSDSFCMAVWQLYYTWKSQLS